MTLREEREAAEGLFILLGIFHFYFMKFPIFPIFVIYLILNQGFTDVVKGIIAFTMFFYITFLFTFLTLDKKEKAKFKKSVNGELLILIGIVLAFCFGYLIFQI
mgnify:CR=1 FL=1